MRASAAIFQWMLALSGLARGAGFLTPSNAPPAVTLALDASADATVGGYNLYYGAVSGSYTNRVGTTNTQCTVSNLVRGATYYFAATCVATNGLESGYSSELSYTPPTPPAAPVMRPLVVLVVESRPAGTGAWQDAGMFWSLSPSATNQLFRLRLAAAQQP